jgi:hypothetical protein
MGEQLHVVASLPPAETTRRLGVPQSLKGRCGEEKNLLFLPGIEPLTILPVSQSLY